MGKKTCMNQRLFLLAVCLILVLPLTGCKKSEVQDHTSESSLEKETVSETNVPEIPLMVENPEEVNIAGMLQEILAGSAVQLNAGSVIGSGVILALNEEETVIVTARHVVEQSDEVSILFADGSSAQSMDIRKSDSADAALIRVPSAQLAEDTINACRKVTVNKKEFDALSENSIIIVMGSVDGTAANAYEGVLLNPWIYMEDFEQHMMLARTWAFPGMSGGGVFDQKGYFIGILCGGNDENEIAVLPLSIIVSEYEKYMK